MYIAEQKESGQKATQGMSPVIRHPGNKTMMAVRLALPGFVVGTWGREKQDHENCRAIQLSRGVLALDILFTHCCVQYPGNSELRDERVISAQSSRTAIHNGGESCSRSLSQQSQEAEKYPSFLPLTLFIHLFIQPRMPAVEWNLPQSSWVFLSQLT